ncbi:LytR/AlgR family response regulator transcription factor [Spirosoma endophyticum]|uniref:LytTr DNA-binding domain-containing protein n=1 Tax=Spirosoma endophyticum TaxID=662367 RepID=A0A1I2HR87_9BACT|nr:LytTR family DNA-binding domain-containing protein [Spirosoma endophyticum]SFF32785.1 LytTr DNA-binding domain-containing protein [Spirosoma endophyticum]
MLPSSKPEIPFLLPGYRHIRDAQLIVRLEGDGNYTNVYLDANPTPLLVSRTLKWFEAQLPTFIRLSKSTLVNPGYIEQVRKVDAKTVYLKLVDKHQLLVSRRRVGETLARLTQCSEPA